MEIENREFRYEIILPQEHTQEGYDLLKAKGEREVLKRVFTYVSKFEFGSSVEDRRGDFYIQTDSTFVFIDEHDPNLQNITKLIFTAKVRRIY